MIIAQLTQANAALAAKVPELEAPVQQPMPSEEAPDAAQEAATDAPGPRPGGGGTGPQNGSEEIRRRSWWREFFGFGE